MSRRYLPFQPFPTLSNNHAQTLIASQLPLNTNLPSVTNHVNLPDGDQLALEISTPTTWQKNDLTVVLVHGLCSSHLGHYMVRLTRKLYARGIRAVRMNLRGCGSGYGLAKQIYHSGRSEDVLAVITELHKKIPTSNIVLVGVSLGGNLVLKLAGEKPEQTAAYVKQVVAVCPPAHLKNCSRLLSTSANKIYDQHFVNLLKADVAAKQKLFPDLPRITLPKKMSLYDFDNLYTAPRGGFKNADDYYAQCSSAPVVKNSLVPCHILFAEDDPFIDPSALDDSRLPPHIKVFHTRRGGHVGFLGHPGNGRFYWLDGQIMNWVTNSANTPSNL
jgi:uncharacterized protein